MATKVVNVKKEAYDVYIGRPMPGRAGSPFGNPFRIGSDGSRDEVIERYRGWLIAQPRLMEQLGTLKGKRLGCWCHPQRCHGDVLVELVEGPAPDRAPSQASLFAADDTLPPRRPRP